VVDASGFVEKLVDEVSEAEADLRKSILGFQEEQHFQNKAVRKSLTALGNLVLEISERLKTVEDSPVGVRKSVLSKSEISERFEPEFDFNKSQVLDALVELAQRGVVQPVDVSRYEGTNSMDPPVLKAVQDHLRKSVNA
jgi:hypothetical protein